MFSAVLDVAIGLIVVFLILSIMASAVSEVVGNVLQRRSRGLERFLASMLLNSGIQVKDFYEKTLLAPHMLDNQRPSYIQSADFVDALFTMLRARNPSAAGPTAGEMPDFTMDELKALVASLPDGAPLKQVLSSVMVKSKDDPLVKDLGSDLAKVRATLEKWYDNSMDRVSGWYKRWTQYLILFIGVGVALVFNIDTLSITNNLLQNPALRSAISAKADAITQTLVTPVPGSNGSNNSTGPGGTPAPGQVSSASAYVSTLEEELQSLNLPIGWPDPTAPANPDLNWWLRKLAGILITGFATSQGAPFWFDLLNRITNLRGTGKPPEKSAIPTS